jgi:hypothetical protein
MNSSVRNRATDFAQLLMYALEFDFRTLGDGRSSIVRYANNSQYRNDSLIRKESTASLSITMKRASDAYQCV